MSPKNMFGRDSANDMQSAEKPGGDLLNPSKPKPSKTTKGNIIRNAAIKSKLRKATPKKSKSSC